MQSVTGTQFHLPGQSGFYRGKVRDVYQISNNLLLVVATDRISAFDVVLPVGIPGKGQVLNSIASYFLDTTADIVPNWKLSVPDPMVTVGIRCVPYKVEMVVRGHLSGHAWRLYEQGCRQLGNLKLPQKMKENDLLPHPVITPTTKADSGHDTDISPEEILNTGLMSKEEYRKLEEYSLRLFERGQQIASGRGLILADTKYEFGKSEEKILLIDEVHTPDSSRYFVAEGFEERQLTGEPQKQLSKEFVRKWLMENGFSGKEGQKVPQITQEFQREISLRYLELYTILTGHTMEMAKDENLVERIERNCLAFLKSI